MEYKVWSGAVPEVPISTVYEGAKICEEFKPQVLIALGGGSVMDTTKMVMVKYEKPEINLMMILPYFGSLGLRKKMKYFVAIPTTSGTGSEVTQAAVITDTDREPLIVFIAICSIYATYYAFSRFLYTISANEVMPLIIGVWTIFWSLVLLKVYFSLRK